MFDQVIVIEAATLCNLSCSFCAYDSRLKKKRIFFDAKALERFIQTVGTYSDLYKKKILISWLGGEPLLHKAIFPITHEAKEKFTNLFFSATTNGTPLVDANIVAHCATHYHELTLSIDGFEDFHDRMRGREGLTKELFQRIEDIHSLYPLLRLRANVVLMRDNMKDFPELCQSLFQKGIQEITFNQLGGRDRPEFYPEHRLLPEQVQDLRTMVSKIQSEIKNPNQKLIFNDAYYNRIYASTNNIKLPINDCAPGKQYMFISAKGIIAPCPYTEETYGIAVEDIISAEMFKNIPHRFSEKRKEFKDHYCSDCPCTNVHGKFNN